MGDHGEAAGVHTPGLAFGVPGEMSPLSPGASGNRTPSQSPNASHSPGSSRIAAAYRLMKQWVEDALVSSLNPTVHHVSRHQNCPQTAAEPPSLLADSSSPAAHKRDSNTGASVLSRSNCSATPLSFTHPVEAAGPPCVVPGCPSEGSCHYSNGLPWQASPSHVRPRWPPLSSHEDGSGRDPSAAQLRLTSAEREPGGISRLQLGREDGVSAFQQTSRGDNGCFRPPAAAAGEATSKQHATPRGGARADAEEAAGREAAKNQSHPPNSWVAGTRGSCEAVLKAGKPEAAGRPPSELQYGSFRVRWGDIKRAPSQASRLRSPSMGDSPTDCDGVSPGESRGEAGRQPADQQGAAAFDVAIPGAVAVGAANSGAAKAQGFQNTESLLWKMKGRLSSTFWSKTSGGSPAHVLRGSRSGPAKSSAAPMGNTHQQGSVRQRNDPQFHRHQTLVFRDPEIERSYGEFLRKARVKRLLVVGVLTILLNTMYDMPEWMITLTSPALRPHEEPQALSQTDKDSIALPASVGGQGSATASMAYLLVPLDVIEVLLQVVLAISGYLPFLKLHTEKTAVLIMLSTSLLSSVRPVALLLLRGPQLGDDATQRETLITPVQAIMTSTFLRSIVGSVLIDLVCLVRRQKLCHFHKLLSLLLLALLVTCTVGGMQLGFHYSFFVFSWTVGLATGVVIASCHAGAYMSELMHRKAFHSVSTISAKLQRIQEENKSQRATGKNMLEQLVGLLKQMGASLNAIDPGNLEKPVRDTLLQVSALQAKCLGVLTSGRDMYAVNWLAPEVPREMQVLYKKFIEPYVRQDSVVVGPQDLQVFSCVENPQERPRSQKELSFPCGGGAGLTTAGQHEPDKADIPNEPSPFQPLKVPLSEGLRLPEVEPACLTQNLGVCGVAKARSDSNLVESTQGAAHARSGQAGQQAVASQRTVLPAYKPNGVDSRDRAENCRNEPLSNGSGDTEDATTTRAHPDNTAAALGRESTAADGRTCVQSASLWGGLPAQSDFVIEESLKSPAVSSFASSVGTEWTIDMFAIDQATSGNSLVFVGLQLLLPHIRNGGLACSLMALHAFLKSLQEQYLLNLYHNGLHGAMVAHLSVMLARMSGLSRTFQLRLATPTDVVLTAAASTHTLARGNTLSCKQLHSREGKLMETSTSSLTPSEAQAAARRVLDDEVVVCLAALGHDVGHPGLNNAFLVSTNQSIALVYNDNAVLENYHAYLTFKTISSTASVDGGILKGFSAAAYRQLRRQIIDLILATDMAQHFPTLSSFRARHASHTFSIATNEEDKWMLAKLLIKTGDIGHAMLAWDQHYAWACRVNEEFYKQGDVEEQLGAAISPLCDRRKAAEMPAAQCGFLEYIVLPLATEIRSCLETQIGSSMLRTVPAAAEARSTAIYLMDGVIAHANYNLRCWKSMTTPATPRMQESGSSAEPLPTCKGKDISSKTEQEAASQSDGKPDS
ncbi:hypothetical protein Efla_005787 [Eimeria flavescens]